MSNQDYYKVIKCKHTLDILKWLNYKRQICMYDVYGNAIYIPVQKNILAIGSCYVMNIFLDK